MLVTQMCETYAPLTFIVNICSFHCIVNDYVKSAGKYETCEVIELNPASTIYGLTFS